MSVAKGQKKENNGKGTAALVEELKSNHDDDEFDIYLDK